MRLADWKVRVGGSGIPLLFHVEADPLEKTDLARQAPVERRFLTDVFSTFLVNHATGRRRSGIQQPEARLDADLEVNPAAQRARSTCPKPRSRPTSGSTSPSRTAGRPLTQTPGTATGLRRTRRRNPRETLHLGLLGRVQGLVQPLGPHERRVRPASHGGFTGVEAETTTNLARDALHGALDGHEGLPLPLGVPREFQTRGVGACAVLPQVRAASRKQIDTHPGDSRWPAAAQRGRWP